ncbi:MAG TPA: winged helix-turn-helix domain-containing protein [Polyangiales bacterium]|nr:winged helix-turn-helix domain-containing protein [Polyangiales bacterium]
MVVNQVEDPLDQTPLDPAALDLLQLGLFAGMAANQKLRERLAASGVRGVRDSHGFIIQHLLRGPHSASELAELLGISQQAVSKSLAELARWKLVQPAPSDDRRVRKLRLSARGRAVVTTSRTLRRELEAELIDACGEQAYAQAKSVLLTALDALGALPAIRERKLRP